MKGVVDAVRRDGKGLKIGEDWYSAFDASQMAGIGRGDHVEFDFAPKGMYKNIKGNVSKVADSGGATTGVSTEVAKPSLARERTIIRQNALSHATTLVVANTNVSDPTEMDSTVEEIIRVARMFEAYATGDSDLEEAEAALAEMEDRAVA